MLGNVCHGSLQSESPFEAQSTAIHQVEGKRWVWTSRILIPLGASAESWRGRTREKALLRSLNVVDLLEGLPVPISNEAAI